MKMVTIETWIYAREKLKRVSLGIELWQLYVINLFGGFGFYLIWLHFKYFEFIL